MASVLTVTGDLGALTTMYAATGFSGRSDEAITLTDTTAAASALSSLDTKTTGTINASTVTTLTGTASQVASAFASAGITGLGNAAIDVTGGSSNEMITGTAWNDIIDGGAGADTLTGGLGSDSFVFVAGQAYGDIVTDYSGLSGQNDRLVFEGYGTGATFTDLGGGQYEIANASRTIVDLITLTNYSGTLIMDFII